MSVSRNATRVTRKQRGSYRDLAARIGCSVGHLWLVVNGRRQSPRLLQRYEALKGASR